MFFIAATWLTMVCVARCNSCASPSPSLPPSLYCRRSAESCIGVSGFLISCARRRATSPHAASRIRVSHVGRALEEDMVRRANELMQRFPRYRWLGEIPHWQVRRKLAHSHLMVISSRMEGGANVVCEALAAGVPVLASRVAGNVGMLGEDYAGHYPA